MINVTLGVIIGNRGVFPGALAENGRREILDVLRQRGIAVVVLPESDAKYGAIENLAEARKCADLFRQNRDKIDGVLVSLPNFGDERAIADTLRLSELNVPVMVHAYPDELDKLSASERRDSFCGKLSICNVLAQYGIAFSVGVQHTVSPHSETFARELEWFGGVCRVVRGLRRCRIGCLGARTTPFKTVRYSEKLLERAGISVETTDLSEIFMAVEKLDDSDAGVQSKVKSLAGYCSTVGISSPAILNMAKLALVIDRWIEENDLDACAIQCWSAIQDALGIFPCTVLSMLNAALMPAACEADVAGAVSMHALQLASGAPSTLLDWNNNYGDDPDKMILFHCSSIPTSMLEDAHMNYNAIAAKLIGEESSYGACMGRIKPGPFTFARVSVDDTAGRIVACIGDGEFTDDPLETFGGVGVAKIQRLQELLRWLCKNGFEHHVAISRSLVGNTIHEAMDNYLGWTVHYHGRNG